MSIQRNSANRSIALTTSAATSPVINMANFAGGLIEVDAGVTLTFYHCDTEDGTFRQLYDSTITAVSRVATGAMSLPLPSECFAARFLRIVANTGTPTIKLSLKS